MVAPPRPPARQAVCFAQRPDTHAADSTTRKQPGKSAGRTVPAAATGRKLPPVQSKHTGGPSFSGRSSPASPALGRWLRGWARAVMLLLLRRARSRRQVLLLGCFQFLLRFLQRSRPTIRRRTAAVRVLQHRNSFALVFTVQQAGFVVHGPFHHRSTAQGSLLVPMFNLTFFFVVVANFPDAVSLFFMANEEETRMTELTSHFS